MALPTYVGIGTQQAGTGAVTPTIPAGSTTDDIMLLFVESNSSQPAAAPSGWTEFPDSPQDEGGSGSTCLSVFWKRHDGSESNPTVADTGNHTHAVIITVRGCITTGDPFDVTAGNVANSTTTAVSVPGDTTTVADCFIVGACTHGTDLAVGGTEFDDTWANASLANLTQRFDNTTDAGGGGGLGIFTGEKAAAGVVSATTATLDTASEQGRFFVALKPPAGGADDHEQPVDDGVTATDATTLARGKAVADTATAADALTFARGKLVADAVTATDATTFARTIVVSDTVTVADEATPVEGGGVDHEQPVDDTVTSTDAVALAIGKAVADTVTAADATALTRGLLVADTVTVADEATPAEGGGVAHTQEVDDTVTVTDALTFARGLAVTDTVTILEALALARALVVADTVTVTDDVTAAEGIYVPVPFGSPSPTGGMILGSPNGGTGEGHPGPVPPVGTPGGTFFGPPSPNR